MRRAAMRRAAMLTMLIGGLVLMAVSYFVLLPRWGTTGEEFSNPTLQFAPVIFIIGILSAFGSAVIYELIPDRKSDDPG